MNVTEKDGDVIFSVRAVPQASKSEIVGEYNGALKIKLNAPPVDGAANQELIKLLSKTFGVARRQIEILAGHTSRNKQLKVCNFSSTLFEQIVTDLDKKLSN